VAEASGVPRQNGTPDGGTARRALLGKIARSLLIAAVMAGLPAFATFGAFDGTNDPFPNSVVAPSSEAPAQP
jgi:hypothetical protein